MAFMALFGWVFIPIIILYFILQAVTAPLRWAAANPAVLNAVTAGLLVLNLLLFCLFLCLRKRRRRKNQTGIWFLLAALWEAWVVLLCALFLVFQPLQYIPADVGRFPAVEENKEPSGEAAGEHSGEPDPDAPPYWGTWTVADCLGTAGEDPPDPELVEKTLGAELNYWADRVLFLRTDFGGGSAISGYKESAITAEEFADIYGTSLEALGIEPYAYLHVALEEIRSTEPFFADLGGRFLLLDEETLLLCSKGAFFRAERLA